MIWSIGQFPELDHLEPGQRQAVLRQLPRWTYPLIVLRAVVFSTVLAGMWGAGAWALFGPRAAVALGALVVAGASVAFYLLELRRLRAAVRQAVSEGFNGRRPPFCLGCGYDLRASDAPYCPECGRAAVATTDADSESPAGKS